MKKILFILLPILVLAGLALAAVFLWPKAELPPPSGGTEFPIAGTGAVATTSVAMQNGGRVITRDFIHNGTTVEDPTNAGKYYLAGETGYCTDQGVCVSGARSDEFSIVYYPEDSSFLIALTAEPLGQSRKDAEQFLENVTGLSGSELCALNYYVGTDSYKNPQFAGTNLGFSFCPGATKLP